MSLNFRVAVGRTRIERYFFVAFSNLVNGATMIYIFLYLNVSYW